MGAKRFWNFKRLKNW